MDVTPYVAFQQALPVSEGFGVRYVDPDSPAAAGFRIDDIIVEMLDYTSDTAPNLVPTDVDDWLGGVLD